MGYTPEVFRVLTFSQLFEDKLTSSLCVCVCVCVCGPVSKMSHDVSSARKRYTPRLWILCALGCERPWTEFAILSRITPAAAARFLRDGGDATWLARCRSI